MRITLPSGTPAEIARPTRASGIGLVITPDIFGLRPLYDDMAVRFADEWGMTVVAVEPFPGRRLGDEVEPRFEAVPELSDDDHLRDLEEAADATGCDTVGLIGFCMGGMLTFLLAAQRPDRIKAAVPFYGFPSGDSQPDYSRIEAAIQGHMAENDYFFPPAAAHELEQTLRGLGKDATLTVHEGSGHAFMAPHNALGTQDAELSAAIWPQAMSFLHEHLG